MYLRAICYVVASACSLILPSCGSRERPSTQSAPSASTPVPDSQSADVTDPKVKPVSPLKFKVPDALPEQLNGTNFKKLGKDDLFLLGRLAAEKQNYRVAAIAQYWYVQKAQTGRYDLACYLAQTGEIDPAFYWLQIAAIEEGVDTSHAKRDTDLVSLRADPRWAKVVQYMEHCNRYFEAADISQTLLILPKGYKTTSTIPAVLWMHGMGSHPEGFVNQGSQELADKLNIALIGVSGTKARGPRSFVWAENVELDAKRVRNALTEVSDRVTIEKGKVITFGFSQGAQMGLEVAVSYPEEFAGSIVLSPGAEFHLDSIRRSPLLAKRAYVVSCGAEEHPGNVLLTKKDAEWLRQAKAKVLHKPYPGVSAHSFPEDVNERFPEWIEFILKANRE